METVLSRPQLSAVVANLKSFRKAHPWATTCIAFIVLFILFFVISWNRLDPDFGWHLQAGNYIRANGIPAHDVFTYTARSFPWIDHEWGNDVVISILYELGGYALLAACFAAMWSVALMVAGWRAKLVTLLVAGSAVLPYAGIRTVSWTVLFLAVTLFILRARKVALTWLLPPLFVIWANVHGGFVIGLAILLYVALYERRLQLFPVFLLSALATFANPYGPRLYSEIARTLFDPTLHNEIGEWTPLTIHLSAAVFVIFWVAGSYLYAFRPLKQWVRPSVILFAGALSATRNVPLFVIAALYEVNDYVVRLWQSIPPKLTDGQKAALVAIACLLVSVGVYGAQGSLGPLGNREAAYPVQGVAYLRAHGCEGGNIFNDYDFGGYLIWKLPGMPVYIDGRMPSWRDSTGQKYFDRSNDILNHPSLYPAEFQRYDIKCVMLKTTPAAQKLLTALKNNQWQVRVNGVFYELLTAPEKAR